MAEHGSYIYVIKLISMDTIKAMANEMKMTGTMKNGHLEIARQLIELKFGVKVTSIEFEDGSGRSFNVTTSTNPLKKQHIRL